MRIGIGLLLICSVLATQSARAETAPVRIIFDTDMDSDCDDVGALAMLHVMADRGEAVILATIASSKSDGAVECIDAINTYFGPPDIPIGSPKGDAPKQASKFAREIAKRFPHKITPESAEDATALYRRILSAQSDGSVVIVTVGDLTNIAALLKLPAAGGGPSGIELVRKKVREWACMGGNFIGHPAKDDLKLSNNNFTSDKAGSLYAVQNWPVKLTFVGREIGSVPSGLKAGARLNELPESSPIRMGYQFYFGGKVKDRHVADQTTVLYAVRGLRDYWDAETKGCMDLQPDMTFEWRYDKDKQHSYLLKRKVDGKPNDALIEKTIEDLMLQPPKK
jgi:hypothetical protein